MTAKSRLAAAAAIVATALLGAASPAAAQAMIEGAWRSGNGSEIAITPCSSGFCGAITVPAVSDADLARYGDAETARRSFVDEHNADAALRTRPLVGLDILRVRATGNPWHFEGEVYNPSDGKTYSGAVTVTGADTMILKGCAVIVFCREEQWTRVVR